MLLTWRDSLLGWSRLGWYGHWMVLAALVFFYGGGMRWLKRLQAARVKKAGGVKEIRAEEFPGKTASGATTPSAQTLPPLDEVAREMEKAEFMRKLSE